eukprot:gene3908-4162_t
MGAAAAAASSGRAVASMREKPAVVRPHTASQKRQQPFPMAAVAIPGLIAANASRMVATVASEMGAKAMTAVVLFWLQSLLVAIAKAGCKEYSFEKEYKVSAGKRQAAFPPLNKTWPFGVVLEVVEVVEVVMDAPTVDPTTQQTTEATVPEAPMAAPLATTCFDDNAMWQYTAADVAKPFPTGMATLVVHAECQEPETPAHAEPAAAAAAAVPESSSEMDSQLAQYVAACCSEGHSAGSEGSTAAASPLCILCGEQEDWASTWAEAPSSPVGGRDPLRLSDSSGEGGGASSCSRLDTMNDTLDLDVSAAEVAWDSAGAVDSGAGYSLPSQVVCYVAVLNSSGQSPKGLAGLRRVSSLIKDTASRVVDAVDLQPAAAAALARLSSSAVTQVTSVTGDAPLFPGSSSSSSNGKSNQRHFGHLLARACRCGSPAALEDVL